MKKQLGLFLAIASCMLSIQNSSAATNSPTDQDTFKSKLGDEIMSTHQNKVNGEKFLADNKSKPGVVTLPSGLQYKIIEEGTGAKPTATSKVTVDYEGTLIDGTVFDSSYKRGQSISFPVNGVIKGWTEALKLMPAGSTWMLYIPSDLAYGSRGAGGVIGPDSTLVFKVHLISVQ